MTVCKQIILWGNRIKLTGKQGSRKSSSILNVQESWVFCCIAAWELQEAYAKNKSFSFVIRLCWKFRSFLHYFFRVSILNFTLLHRHPWQQQKGWQWQFSLDTGTVNAASSVYSGQVWQEDLNCRINWKILLESKVFLSQLKPSRNPSPSGLAVCWNWAGWVCLAAERLRLQLKRKVRTSPLFQSMLRLKSLLVASEGPSLDLNAVCWTILQ